MRKTIFTLALALIVVAYGSTVLPSSAPIVSNSPEFATKVESFSEDDLHAAVELTGEYKQFANALEKYNSTTPVVKKGSKRPAVQASVLSLPSAHAASDVLPVFDQPDIPRKYQLLANKALTSLPERCWGTLENFYILPDSSKGRAFAGATTMMITKDVSDKEFYALFMHEIGHVFDLNPDPNCLGGTPASGYSNFKDGPVTFYNDDPSLEQYEISWLNETTLRPDAKPADFVSEYSMTNAFEAFAEENNFFLTNNAAFREMAIEQANKGRYALAKKYNFFAAFYPSDIYLTKGKHKNSANSDERVWDTTKLDFEIL